MDIIASKLLQACLDTSHHNPVWIIDQFGSIVASNCKAEEFNFHDIDFNSALVKINNSVWKVSIKELNHGTNCYLYELENEEDNRLQNSVDKLAEFLEKRTFKSAKM